MTVFVGVTGAAGVGKDTAANLLVKHYGFVRASLADEIRSALTTLDPYLPDGQRISAKVADCGWDSAKRSDPEIRRLLQVLGTEVVRFHREDFWIEVLKSRIDKDKSNPQYVVVPDIRFDNEARWILGTHPQSVVVEIIGSREDQVARNGHLSESGISPKLVSFRVKNHGTMDDLHMKLLDVVEHATR
jgi:hypothetical protein